MAGQINKNMLIICEKEFDNIGGEYMQEKKVEVDIQNTDKYVFIEFEGQCLTIPIEVFKGLLNN
jgi:hypothetical protein